VILVVDDEAVFLEAAHCALQADGYEVKMASSAAEALELATEQEPELILSDVRMPGMGGFEFRDAYASRHPARSTPFVFMTSMGEPGEIVKGLDAGADDYLVKPVIPGVLRARVRALLRRYRRWSAPSFRGDLTRFPFVKILRFCEVNCLSGAIDFEVPGLDLKVPIRAGSPLIEDPEIEAGLERLYDAREGTFTIRTRPVNFEELSTAATEPAQQTRTGSTVVEERPMGRLSAVEAGSRLIQIQTEFVTQPAERVLTVALLDGRAVLKRVGQALVSAARRQIEEQIETQHASVEAEVREKLETLSRQVVSKPPSAKERFDRLFEAGFEAYRARRYDDALKSWSEAHELFPEDKPVQVNLQIVRQKLLHLTEQQ
jgi:CheY-like chemotaxis protein